MAVMSEEWEIIAIIAIIVLSLVLIVLIVRLWRRYRRERQRNRRSMTVPEPEDILKRAEQTEKEEFLRTVRTDEEEVVYANVPSTLRNSEEKIYENILSGCNERFTNRQNVPQSSDMNLLLSQGQHEVTIIKTYSTGEIVNKPNVPESTNTLGTTSQQNMPDPMDHTAVYNLNTTTSPVQNIPNVATSRVMSSKTNLDAETIHTPMAKGGKNMSSLPNKSTEFVSRHNNMLTISWDFQKDKNMSSVDSESLPVAGCWRSRTNSLPSKVIIDKNKLQPSLHHKITLELSTGSNPDILYDIPKTTNLSSEHKTRFKSVGNQFNERSSKCVVYENVIIRTDW